MMLMTYRLNQKRSEYSGEDLRMKANFMFNLYTDVLRKDKLWHYFYDDGGATLRFSLDMEGKVRKYLKSVAKERGFTFRRATKYDPKRHEYFGVAYLGEDILPLFHEISVLTVQYPPYVTLRPVFERLNHALINQTGIHNFAAESELYLNLAMGRARMVGYPLLRLPKIFYKWYIRLFRRGFKEEKKS